MQRRRGASGFDEMIWRLMNSQKKRRLWV